MFDLRSLCIYSSCFQGMPGATAYFGLKEAAPFKKDDLVLVSGTEINELAGAELRRRRLPPRNNRLSADICFLFAYSRFSLSASAGEQCSGRSRLHGRPAG